MLTVDIIRERIKKKHDKIKATLELETEEHLKIRSVISRLENSDIDVPSELRDESRFLLRIREHLRTELMVLVEVCFMCTDDYEDDEE